MMAKQTSSSSSVGFQQRSITPGNSQVDDSIAERFLYGGNIILNCADYAFLRVLKVAVPMVKTV